jgi:hypothetical protein
MANDFDTLQPGTWEDGSTVAGDDLRRGAAGQLGSLTGAVSVRGGVRWSPANPLSASLPGGMVVRITAGVGYVPTPDSGAYCLTNEVSNDLTVTAANGTNPRIDTVGLEVVPGSPTTWRLRMLDGTANVSPVAPTYAVAGGFFLPLWDVRVNALATVPTTLTDRRKWVAPPGGMVRVPGALATPTLTDDIVPGTPVWDPTAGVPLIRNETALRRLTTPPISINPDGGIWGTMGGTFPTDPNQIRMVTGQGVITSTSNPDGRHRLQTGFTQCLLYASAQLIDPDSARYSFDPDFAYQADWPGSVVFQLRNRATWSGGNGTVNYVRCVFLLIGC